MSGYAHTITTNPCPSCGQGRIATDTGTICPRCRAGQYAGNERHESPQLFEPAPAQLPGQLGMEGGSDAR